MSAGVELRKLQAAGFTDQEIADWSLKKRQELSRAGFNEAEIDTWFGQPPFDPKPIQEFFRVNIGKLSIGGEAKPVTSFQDAVEAGLQLSVPGLMARKQSPSKVLAEDAPLVSRIASQTATLAGDLPFMVGGFLLGGAAGAPTGPGATVTGTAGAFAVPMGLRKILMDKYEKGEVETFSDFWDRLSGTVIDTVKGWATGAATGAAGVVAGGVVKGAGLISPAARTAVTLGAEIPVMVTVGKALEGEMPNAQNFVDAAIVLGGVKGAAKTAAKLRQIYTATGVRPEHVVADAAKDPTVAQDILSSNIVIPRIYADALADQLAKERASFETVKKEKTGQMVIAPVEKPEPTIAELAKSAQPRSAELGQAGTSLESAHPVIPDRTIPRTDLNVGGRERTTQFEKPGFLRSAEEINAGRSTDFLKTAEEKIAERPEPSTILREQHRFILKGKGFDLDVGEISRELQAKGITFGEDAEPNWFKMIYPSKTAGTTSSATGPQTGQAPAPVEPLVPATKPSEQNKPVDTPQQAILDRIVQERPETKRLTWEGLYTKLVDNLNPIKLAEKEAGKQLEAAESPYLLSRLTRGVYGKGDQFIKRGTFDFDTYETTGKGYEEVLKPVQKDLDGFRAYMASRHAIELSQKEGRIAITGIPLEEAKQVVKQGRLQYEGVFKDRLKYKDSLIDYLKQSGILSQEAVDAMRQAYKAHVSFYRFFEEDEIGRATVSSSVKNPLKEKVGSERKILDPIESDVKDTFLFIGLAEKNAARQAFVKLGPEFAKPVHAPSVPISKADLKLMMEEHGLSEDAIKSFEIFRPSTFQPEKNQIAVFEDGKRTVYQVHPDVAEAFNAADKASSDFLTKMLAAPASWLRAGVTISPDFFPRNMIRDALSAFIYAGSHPIKTAKGLGSLITQDTAFQRWMKAGGANATMVAMDRDYIQQHLFKLNAETGVMERALNVAKTPIEILRVASELAENATRLGSARNELLAAKTKAAMQAAAIISREATVDFARHGSDPSFQQYTRMTAFMNPGIQGMDRMVRAFHDNPAGTLSKSFMAITIPSLYLWWANHDDPRWADIPRWQKDLFWIVMTPEHIYRIPKPFELGVVFGSMPERVLEQYVAENPNGLKDLDHSMLATFGINVIPTFSVPLIEQFGNRSLFTGQAMIPAHLENVMPEYQYTEYTTEAAKALGSIIGAFPGLEKAAMTPNSVLSGTAQALTTPILIENYLRAWTGGLGMYALKIADGALREAGVLPDPVEPAKSLADLPVIKAFVVRYPSASAQSIQDFYDAYDEKKIVFTTMMQKAKEGDFAAMEKARAFDPSAMVQLDDIRQTLIEQGQLVRLISKNPQFSAGEQRQMIDAIYGRMIELSRAGVTILQTAERSLTQPRQSEAVKPPSLTAPVQPRQQPAPFKQPFISP